MTATMRATIEEINASHVSMISDPDVATALIENAAKGLEEKPALVRHSFGGVFVQMVAGGRSTQGRPLDLASVCRS